MSSSTELDRPLPPGGLTPIATAPAHDEEINIEYANENPNLAPQGVAGVAASSSSSKESMEPPPVGVPKDVWYKQQQMEQSYDPSIVLSQEEILFKLIQYRSEASKKWAAQQVGWSPDGMLGTANPACGWAHVACDPYTNQITKINLSNQHLPIALVPELQQLTSLTELNLDNNAISGYIPNFIFESFNNLEYLVLSNNDLVGTIPSMTDSLVNLRVLDLQSNRLGGTVPYDIGDVTSTTLEKLDVSHNAIKGGIPKSITQCKNLGFLDLSNNQMDGTIPKEIGDLKVLKGLFLNNNNLIGTIPYTLARAELPLIQVFLEHNQLSGTIPAGLSELMHLRDLFVDGNKLTGTVPQDLCVKDPPLNNDFFTGKYATPSRDGCTSVACPAGTVSAEGVAPCYACEMNGQINHQYKYLGVEGMKCQYWNQRDVLLEFYDQANGLKWENDDGWAIDGVNECSWKGITCTPQGHVVNITLEGLNLQGTIATQLGLLEHLKVLNLSNNNLSGYLPSDLRFAPLEVLDIRNNHIQGHVPPMLCLAGTVNGNGIDGHYNCDSIACPAGYYGETYGRMMFEIDENTGQYVSPLSPQIQCIPCLDKDAIYMGRTYCTNPVAFSTSLGNVTTTEAVVGGVILAIFMTIMACVGLWYTHKIRIEHRQRTYEKRRAEEEKQALQIGGTRTAARSGGGGGADDGIEYDFEGERLRDSSDHTDAILTKKQQEEYWMTAAGIDVDAPSMDVASSSAAPESQHPTPEVVGGGGGPDGNGGTKKISPTTSLGGSYDASQANRAVPMPIGTISPGRSNNGSTTSPTTRQRNVLELPPQQQRQQRQQESGNNNDQDNELWLDVPKIV